MNPWRVGRDGIERGPFTEVEVLELIGRAQVRRGEFISFYGGQWFPIEQAPAFSAALPPIQMPYVPPPPTFVHYQAAPVYVPVVSGGCPRCGTFGSRVTKSSVTSAGWLTFFLCLLLCLPVSIYALLAMRESRTSCNRCGALL